MTTISTEQNLVTLINVFTVRPEEQQHLVDVLADASENVISKQPGYISANLHKSLDGTKVTNYAQWRTREDYEAMLKNPESIPHMREAAGIAGNYEPDLYEVAFVDEVAEE